MKKYRVTFIGETERKEPEFAGAMEFLRNHLTSREHKRIIDALFFLTASNYPHLTATVECDGKKIITYKCATETSYFDCSLTACVKIARPREKYSYLRTMLIAD